MDGRLPCSFPAGSGGRAGGAGRIGLAALDRGAAGAAGFRTRSAAEGLGAGTAAETTAGLGVGLETEAPGGWSVGFATGGGDKGESGLEDGRTGFGAVPESGGAGGLAAGFETSGAGGLPVPEMRALGGPAVVFPGSGPLGISAGLGSLSALIRGRPVPAGRGAAGGAVAGAAFSSFFCCWGEGAGGRRCFPHSRQKLLPVQFSFPQFVHFMAV